MSSWVLINRVLGSLHTLSPGAKIAVRLQPDPHVLPPRLAAFDLPLCTSWHFGGGRGGGREQFQGPSNRDEMSVKASHRLSVQDWLPRGRWERERRGEGHRGEHGKQEETGLAPTRKVKKR